jgi:hypothetical protein
MTGSDKLGSGQRDTAGELACLAVMLLHRSVNICFSLSEVHCFVLYGVRLPQSCNVFYACKKC